MYHLTEEQKSEIFKLFNSRYSLKEIAKMYGIKSADTIRKMTGNAGRKIDRIDKDECIDLYNKGTTLSRLGSIYNVSSASIKNLLKENRMNSETNKIKNFSSNYNPLGELYFLLFDLTHNTKGYHGPNEWLIEDLGYRLDYFNPDLKLIMEWDEPAHKYQILQDKLREIMIRQKYLGFNFFRIKEDKELIKQGILPPFPKI
jgi:hypothetical protein